MLETVNDSLFCRNVYDFSQRITSFTAICFFGNFWLHFIKISQVILTAAICIHLALVQNYLASAAC